MKLISVIVPIYNVVNEVERCVQSILGSTYKNLEIILVDDGSNDGSSELCDRLLKKDYRIKVIHQENKGLAAARLKGFLESRGGVLSFIDSDDYIDQSMYEEMLKSLEEQNADIVFCDYNSITKNNIVKNAFAESDIKLDRERALKFLADDSLKSFMWNKLYKREVLQEEDFYIGRTMEDLLCMHHIFDRCNSIVYCKGGFYNYVRRASSIMGTKNSIYLYWRAWDERLEWYKNYCPEYYASCLNRVVRVGLTYFEEKNLNMEASDYIQNFFKLNLKDILRNKKLNLHKKLKVLFYINKK